MKKTLYCLDWYGDDMKFKRGFFEEQDFWHWKHMYIIDDDEIDMWEAYDEMYKWCLDNLEHIIGWHVRNEGIIIQDPEDAMLFELTWC